MGAKQSKSRSSKKQNKKNPEALPDPPARSYIRIEEAAASSSAPNPIDPKGKRRIVEDEASDSEVSSVSSGHASENYNSNNNVQNSPPVPPPGNNYPQPGMYYDPNYYPQSGNIYPYSYNDPNPAHYHQPNYPSYSYEQYDYPNYTYPPQYPKQQQQPQESFEDKLGAYFFGPNPGHHGHRHY